MDTPPTKRSVKEIVTVDTASASETVDQVNKSFENLIPELLTHIFNWVKAAHPDRTERNAKLAELRRICHHWRDVIDANMSFEPAISDKLITGNYHRLKDMRVKMVAVNRLAILPKASQLSMFYKADWIKEVNFGEKVSREAFLVMAQLLNKMCNVTSVGISHGFSNCGTGGKLAKKDNEKKILTEFLGNVKTLDLKVPYDDLMITGWKGDRSLLELMKSAGMPQLTNLKITGHWRLLISPLPLYFLSRHPTVESICLTTEPFSVHSTPDLFLKDGELAEVERRYWNIPKVEIEDMENIQVKIFSVEGPTMFHIIRYRWMPLILAQRKLEQLKVSHICKPLPKDQDVPAPLLFSVFIDVLQANKSTLTSVELCKFQFNGKLDFKKFQELRQLQTLKLSKNSDEWITVIINMNSLPGSLKSLSINGVGCSNMQLKQFAKASRFNDLKSLELVSIRHLTCNYERSIPEEILKDIFEMKNIHFIHVDAVTINRARKRWSAAMVDKRRYFVVPGGKGPMVHIQDNWDFYDRNVCSHYTLMCRDVKALF